MMNEKKKREITRRIFIIELLIISIHNVFNNLGNLILVSLINSIISQNLFSNLQLTAS